MLAVLLSGCGGGGGSGGTTPTPTPSAKPPTIDNAMLNPAFVQYLGGNVIISAKVVDMDGTVSTVTARVTLGSSSKSVTLTGSSGIYTGSFAAPANSSGTDQVYTVTITATDNAGLSSSSPGFNFTVKASVSPPAPPPL